MNKKGSNQYLKKPKHNAMKYLYWYFAIFLLILFLGLMVRKHTIEQVHAEEAIISPLADNKPTPTQTPEQIATQKEIEGYIKTIFGKDARIAIAVSHNECSPKNQMYPKCNLHTNAENSVGLFQINIQSETARVHWNRIPGKTLDEKKVWLDDPYNNTLLAYWIFQTSGWTPWSAFTSGRYLNDL